MTHLHSIDDTCQERFDLLIPQMKDAGGVTEALKAAEQMEWVCRMNSIHTQAYVVRPAEQNCGLRRDGASPIPQERCS